MASTKDVLIMQKTHRKISFSTMPRLMIPLVWPVLFGWNPFIQQEKKDNPPLVVAIVIDHMRIQT